jgi:ribonucleoside-diphosphate reductase alpha chain
MQSNITKTSKTIEMHNGCGSMFIKLELGKLGKPHADIRFGKSGSCQAAWVHCISVLLSLALRHYTIEYLVKKINGCRCPMPRVSGGVEITSCPDAICKGLEELGKCKEFESLTEAGKVKQNT